MASAAILYSAPAFAQKSLLAQEYVNVTMDLQGVMELQMLTDPQVDFVFNSIPAYKNGIIRYNATILQVDASVPWDLYVQPASQYWQQQFAYGNGQNGQNRLPSELLELQCVIPNASNEAENLNTFIGLNSNFGSNLASLQPNPATQYISGFFGTGRPELTRSSQPLSGYGTQNRFAINYRIRPGIPATFPELAKQYPSVAQSVFPSGDSFAQPGYYELEIVYSLVEDL